MKTYIFDVDDVLRDFVPSIVRQYNYQYNTNHKFEEMVDFELKKQLTKISDFKQFAWNNPRIFSYSKPIEGSVEVVNELKKRGNKIGIATNQFPEMEHLTLEWLGRNNVNYDFVFFGRDKYLLSGDVFIDDKISNLQRSGAMNPYSKLYLIDKPWNKSLGILDDSAMKQFNGIERIKSLEELLK